MSNFNTNSQAYNIVTENELAEVLSHYDSGFVFSVVDQAIKDRFSGVYTVAKPNVVAAWEQNFKEIIYRYGESSTSEVMRVRNETYKEIIDVICKTFHLNFTIDEDIDIYSAALHLYDFMVCNYTTNIITFFANFIYKERSNIYDSLALANLKKNKDTSTIYGKKIYKDIKLAVINANIGMVINYIATMEIPFSNIISTIFGNNSWLKNYFFTIVTAEPDFFKVAYLSAINSDIGADIMTGVRFKLQELAVAHDQVFEASASEILGVQPTEDNTDEGTNEGEE